MSYLVLARKYRPQTFEQVVKQEHVTRTLANAISSGRVSHAILLSGPRGTGKTTVARILAKAMNCKEGPAPVPCNDCRSCREITSGSAVDVFEIDGASNNSVDQIRELRENVKYMPAHSAFKIYIIDEVHMLSTAAFNALLKTLEEPPSHVMFIFATTELHKIPVTILSRCQRYDFRRINVESIVEHMSKLCDQENVKIDIDSLGLIGREAQGSMRDGLSLLDQVMACSQDTITHDQVLDILGVVDRKNIFEISNAVLQKDITRILDILDGIYNAGHDLKKLYNDLLEHFRNLLVVKMGKKISKLVNIPAHEIEMMIDQVNDVPLTFLNQIFDLIFKEASIVNYSGQPRLAIEMIFIKIFQIKPVLPMDVLIEKLDILRREIDEICPEVTVSRKNNIQDNIMETNNVPVQVSSTAESIAPYPAISFDPAESLETAWEKLLSVFLEKYPSLGVNLKSSTLKKNTDQSFEIEITGNDFNINMVKRPKNISIINKVCSDFFEKDVDISIKVNKTRQMENNGKKSRHNGLKQKALSHPMVADVLAIFNAKLVDVKTL